MRYIAFYFLHILYFNIGDKFGKVYLPHLEALQQLGGQTWTN